MKVLPLFPLQIVQFPGAVTPLHIFEPRYRQMLKDVLAGDKTFGIVAVLDGQEGRGGRPLPGSIGCAVEVALAQEMPDGRSNILCVGTQRFRLMDYVEGELYLQGEVEYFEDETAFDDFSEQISEVKKLFARITEAVNKLKEKDSDQEKPELPDDAQGLSFALSAYMEISLTEKQSLLELTDTGERLQRVSELLRDLVASYERRADVQKVIKLNGHGGKLPEI